MMKNEFFVGAVVKIYDSDRIPMALRGQRVILVSRAVSTSQFGTIWNAVDANGRAVLLNKNSGYVIHPQGARPADISLEQLLRTCHVDPKILRSEGAE